MAPNKRWKRFDFDFANKLLIGFTLQLPADHEFQDVKENVAVLEDDSFIILDIGVKPETVSFFSIYFHFSIYFQDLQEPIEDTIVDEESNTMERGNDDHDDDGNVENKTERDYLEAVTDPSETSKPVNIHLIK